MPFRKIPDSSATIVASIIAGTFALSAAVLPTLLDNGPATPTEPAAVVPATVAVMPTPIPSTPVPAPKPALPNLTYGTWTLVDSTDEGGTVWNNSTLKFTSQHETPDGLLLTGFFEWRTGGVYQGREEVMANYMAASRQIFIEGKSVQSIDGRLAIGSFSAKLDEDDRSLLKGTWGTSANNLEGIAGTWNARR